MKAFKRKIFSGTKIDRDQPTSPTTSDGVSSLLGANLERLESGSTDEDRALNGLSAAEAAVLLKIHGKNELPTKVIPKW